MNLPKNLPTLESMEWLLIISLWIAEVERPPPIIYADKGKCVQMAKKIADENKWLYYLELGPERLTVEPGVFRPTVYCLLTEWSNKGRGKN